MPRKVTVATTALRRGRPGGPGGPGRTVDANLLTAERFLERAAAFQPDIICLPENFSVVDVPRESSAQVAEPIPGPTTERIGAAARHHHTYVVGTLAERDGDRVFNTAVLIDRRGQVAGTYRKVHPTIREMERGITPGHQVRVFGTDFGRVAMLICFDVNFAERWHEAKQLGAEIVFWATVDEGGLRPAAYARQNEYYVVSACYGPTWRASILDVTGRELVGTSQRDDVAWAQIDLEKRVFHTDDNEQRYEAILRKYGRRVTAQILSAEETLTLESNDPALTVDDLIAEFGLEPARAYLQRSAAAQAAARTAAAPGSGGTDGTGGTDRTGASAPNHLSAAVSVPGENHA
jgi:beta-ureidopropionase